MDNNGYIPPQVPSNNDLEEVRKLTAYRDSLIEQLRQAEERLSDLWKTIPYDPDILKKPWRSDIHATCRNCGRPTKWRTPKGHAQHYTKKEDSLILECPPDKMGRTTPGIDPSIWAILDMPDDEVADMEDDEILEVIQGKSLSEVRATKVEKKPSEREN